MNKPVTMSHKEWFIKQLALKLVISEKIIDAVVTNQFDGASENLPLKNSIELSGFGKFIFNENRAKGYLKKYNNQINAYEGILNDVETSEADKKKTLKKLETAINHRKSINSKLKLE